MASGASNSDNDDWNGRGFVRYTLRSAWTVGAIVMLVLLTYRQYWALGPFLTGLGLSSALLLAWDVFVRRLLTPQTNKAAREKQKSRKWPIIVFSLIKYPLVGLLLSVAVRLWRGDSYHALAFLGGFILLHMVIGLRALNRALGVGHKE